MNKLRKFYCRFCGTESRTSTWVQGKCTRCGTQYSPKEW